VQDNEKGHRRKEKTWRGGEYSKGQKGVYRTGSRDTGEKRRQGQGENTVKDRKECIGQGERNNRKQGHRREEKKRTGGE